MYYQNAYSHSITRLLADPNVCDENKFLFIEFFEFQIHKLKRKNGIHELDEACYKTLLGYIQRLNNVNKWFNNKPWVCLTKKDITKVYNDLEDGIIKNKNGVPFKDRRSYYNKILKSKPFALAGVNEISREVIEYYHHQKEEVRYIEIDTFKMLPEVAVSPSHKLLLWLAFDIGENISSLLQLQKKDFTRIVEKGTNEVSYRVNLPKEKLKRSRRSRSQLTLFPETTQFIDVVLNSIQDNDSKIFHFQYAASKAFLNRVVKITNSKCIPKGQRVTWKDLRSSMACHLLKEGWTRDHVNARLGHAPSSTEIDKYINFLALDDHVPKQKLYQSNMKQLEEKIEQQERKNRMLIEKISSFEDQLKVLVAKKTMVKD